MQQPLPLRQAFEDTRRAVSETVRADVGRNRRGVALLIVLVTVAVMAALSTEFAYNTRTNIWMSGNIKASTQAYYHARSAMTIATLAVNARQNFPQVQGALNLMGKGKGRRLEIWRRACDFVNVFCTGKAEFFGMSLLDFKEEKAVGVAHGSCGCTVEAEDARINLNAAAAEVMPDPNDMAAAGPGSRPPMSSKALRSANIAKTRGRNDLGIQLYGMFRPMVESGELKDEQELLDLTLNIMDWTDGDDTKTDVSPEGKFQNTNAAEAGDYAQWGYDTKNAKMDTVGEVQLVEGMTSEIYCKVRDKFTVFSTDKINVNDADLLVLKGLVCSSLPEEIQMQECWMPNLAGGSLLSPVDEVLIQLETCRQLKKAVFSTPFSSAQKFVQFVQQVPTVLGLTPVPIDQRELVKQIGTRTKMVRIEAEGTYCWDKECKGVCAGLGDGAGPKCSEDSECPTGRCVIRKTTRKLVSVIDTSTGALVHFHSE